jgi:pimeloyl-ACP methyl ester carboxylesterase
MAATDTRAVFEAAYDAVLDRFPHPVEPAEVATAFGTTRVNVCGSPTGKPLVLLHSGGTNSTVWFAVARELGSSYRVFAVDHLGGLGRSVYVGRPIRTLPDVLAWLDAVLDGLGLDRVHLCGHSYGSWISLNYALHHPERLHRLALLDPTNCFAGQRLPYVLRALPLLLRATPARKRAFWTWEAGGVPLDEGALAAVTIGVGKLPSPSIVWPHRPSPDALRGLRVPALVVLADRTKSHDPDRVEAAARRLLPDVTFARLPEASHHTIPTEHAEEIAAHLTAFLG